MSSIVIVFIVCFHSIRLFSVDCVVSFTTPKLESTNVFQLQYHFVMHIFYFDNATLYFLLCCTFRDGLRISATELSCINVVSVKQKKKHTHKSYFHSRSRVWKFGIQCTLPDTHYRAKWTVRDVAAVRSASYFINSPTTIKIGIKCRKMCVNNTNSYQTSSW